LYPVTTPKGFTVNEDPTGAWPSLGIACDGDVRQTIDVIDSRAMELLADNSQALFRMKCTPDTIVKYKFYTPLAYSKPASVLAPLAGGKVVSSTVVEDEHGHHLDHTGITAGSKVKLILSLNSLYFSAKTKCKTYIKVERVQSVEAGTDVAEVATDFACNSNGSDSSSIQARRAVTKSTGHIQKHKQQPHRRICIIGWCNPLRHDNTTKQSNGNDTSRCKLCHCQTVAWH